MIVDRSLSGLLIGREEDRGRRQVDRPIVSPTTSMNIEQDGLRRASLKRVRHADGDTTDESVGRHARGELGGCVRPAEAPE